MLLAQVVDDDGVLVLASAAKLKGRFATREFNYDFPVELLAGAADEELCAWQTHEEGEVTISVHVGEAPPPSAIFLGVLRIGEEDELLVLPYSQYTLACAHFHGEPEAIEGLSTRLEVDPGRYACSARPAPVRGTVEQIEQAPLVFNVFLNEAAPSEGPLSEVPIIER